MNLRPWSRGRVREECIDPRVSIVPTAAVGDNGDPCPGNDPHPPGDDERAG